MMKPREINEPVDRKFLHDNRETFCILNATVNQYPFCTLIDLL